GRSDISRRVVGGPGASDGALVGIVSRAGVLPARRANDRSSRGHPAPIVNDNIITKARRSTKVTNPFYRELRVPSFPSCLRDECDVSFSLRDPAGSEPHAQRQSHHLRV